jgi:hypothetical protein
MSNTNALPLSGRELFPRDKLGELARAMGRIAKESDHAPHTLPDRELFSDAGSLALNMHAVHVEQAAKTVSQKVEIPT